MADAKPHTRSAERNCCLVWRSSDSLERVERTPQARCGGTTEDNWHRGMIKRQERASAVVRFHPLHLIQIYDQRAADAEEWRGRELCFELAEQPADHVVTR